MGLPRKMSKKVQLEQEIQKLHATYGEEFVNALLNNQLFGGHYLESAHPNNTMNDKTIEEAMEEFFNSNHFLQLADSSKKTYQSEARTFLDFCNKIFPNGTQESVLVFMEKPTLLLEYLKETENLSTRNKRSSFLRSFFKVICKREILNADINFSRVLPIIQNEDEEPKALNQHQVRELLHLAREGNNNFRNYTLLWVMLGSGIRVGEVTQIQIGDIIPETQHLLIIPKKKRTLRTEKVKRKIALPALKTLINYVNFTYGHLIDTDINYKNLYVFSKDGGKTPLTERTIQIIIKDLIDKCQSIPDDEKRKYSTHSLRHTFALSALESGIDIYRISKLLGHEYVKSTEVYLKLFDHHLQEAIEMHPFANIDFEKIWDDET
jgi:integrase/recombinase XerD